MENARKSLLSRVVEAHTGGILRNAIKQADKTRQIYGKATPSISSTETGKPLEKSKAKPDIMPDSMRSEMTHLLLDAVSRCSRQKMRFILMTIRQKSGVDSYMDYNDLVKILQDNGLIVPTLASGMIQNFCSDQLGVDAEKVWKLLMDVHGQSERDSVRARKGMHLRTPVISVFADVGGDREVLERMEEQLLGLSEGTFDYTAFKNAVLALDKTRQGYVANTQLLKVCRDYGFPVKGDLLKRLLIRCDDDNNGKISHRELFVLLDKAVGNALKVMPRLFQKKEELATGRASRNETGRIMREGTVDLLRTTSRLSVGLSRNVSSDRLSALNEVDDSGPGSDTITDITGNDADFKARKTSLAANSVSSLGIEDPKAKGKGGKMKGLFGRKKGNAKETDSPGQSLTLDNSSDSVSMASANYGTIAKGVALTNNGMTGANGLQEKAIRPVVRKIGDHKIILWPPDEYFDTVTPKVREPSLEWVYGYSGFSHRNNIVLLHDTAIIVYFVGRIIVLYNLNADTQRHYCEHDGIVQCISVMSNGTIAASGQQPALEDGPAIVRVWTVDHLQTLHVFKSDASMGSALRKSVAALSFTKEEDAIVAIDDGKPRTMSVWSLETGQMLASKPCTESPVVCGILCLRASSKDPLYLVYGRNLMEIWKIVPTENKIDFVKQCVFGQIPKPSIVTSVIEAPVVVDGMPRTVLISGDSDGNVILWSDEMRPKNVLQNGNKVPVFTLCSLSPSHVMIGSRDGQMGVIRLAGESTVKISKNKIPEQYGGLRMLTPMKDSNSDTGLDVSLSVIAGTTANALLRVTFTTTNGEPEADQHDMQAVTVGHFDEAVGLSTYVHPEDNTRTMAITVGMDGNINCFDLAKHAPAWRTFLKDSMVTAVDCYPPFLVVGTSDAKLKLFHLTEPELTLILQASVGKEKVACLKFSPDGTFFAVASQDGEVHIFRLEETEGVSASFVSKFDKHDYPVIAIDWSRNPARDGHYVIHSNSYEFENLLWDALTTEFLEEAHFYRNVKWLTQNCPFGFASATSVTWDNNSLEGNVVCTDVSPTLDMVAAVVTGQRNQIGLYSYPNANVAVVKRMQPTCSTTITSLKLCYLNNTLYLLCTHGGDGSVSQWALR